MQCLVPLVFKIYQANSVIEEFRSYSRKFKVWLYWGSEHSWKVFVQDLAVEFNSEIFEFICAEKAFALTPDSMDVDCIANMVPKVLGRTDAVILIHPEALVCMGLWMDLGTRLLVFCMSKSTCVQSGMKSFSILGYNFFFLFIY